MAFRKVTPAERAGKGVYGLPDAPGMGTEEIQERFDSLGNLGIDALNDLSDQLVATTAASNMGAVAPEGVVASGNVQSILEALAVQGGHRAIESISVNNIPQPIDQDKNVNIDLTGYAEQGDIPTKTSDLTNDSGFQTAQTVSSAILAALANSGDPYQAESEVDAKIAAAVPTKTSDLTNDGDGQSNFATEAYVAQNGGKIDSISIDGTTQTIDANKNVALDLSDYAKDADLPTAVSDLTNDSGFQTAAEVGVLITTALANSGDAYQTESDVDDKIAEAVAAAYKYKGSVATVADLPASGNTEGDVYDVQATGMNYAWNGTSWDALGTYVDTSVFWTSTTGQTNTLEAATVAEINAILNAS